MASAFPRTCSSGSSTCSRRSTARCRAPRPGAWGSAWRWFGRSSTCTAAATRRRALVRTKGPAVPTAYDGREALDVARQQHPEVVFLDIGLPHLDGYAVASQLRRDSATRDAYLVAMTGYGQEEDRRRSREAGFDHHLVKPV